MAGNDPQDERTLLVVARGQSSLLEAARELFPDLGWIDVIEELPLRHPQQFAVTSR